MRFLCLHLPAWPLQRHGIAQPELRQQAVVLARDTSRGKQVAGCSSRAYQLGIQPDMPLAEAQSLAQTQELVVLPHEPQVDRKKLAELALEAQQFSPLVALETTFEPPHEPFAILLDLTGLAALWKSEAQLAAKVHDYYTQQGWHARVAVADTIGLAWAAARFGLALNDPLPNPAVIATRSPIGQAECARNRDLLIDELPVAALRIEAATVQLLHRLGIERVGQLLALPRAELVPRFGSLLLERIDQLTGHMPEALEACTDDLPLEAQFDFETSVAHAATVHEVLARLVEQVAAAARRRQLGVLQLVATMECDDYAAAPLLLRLLQPTASAAQLNELLSLHMEGVSLHSPVRSLRVRVLSTGSLEQRQGELFATGDRSGDLHQVALLVNRLASRLGDEQVVRAEKRMSSLPERAVAYSPATANRGRSFAYDSATAERMRARPLWLRGRPAPITVDTAPPDDRPVRFVRRGDTHEIVTAIGPERIETGWWHGPHHRRDYYQFETTGGNWWWIYFDLRGRQWYVA